MGIDNDTRWKRVQAARQRQVEVADHLAARARRRLAAGMAGMGVDDHEILGPAPSTELARAAAGLPLEYKPRAIVPAHDRLICRHCGQEILTPKWEWCAEAQKNLRSHGTKIVDGRIVG